MKAAVLLSYRHHLPHANILMSVEPAIHVWRRYKMNVVELWLEPVLRKSSAALPVPAKLGAALHMLKASP